MAASRAGIIVDEVFESDLKVEIRPHFKADGFRKNPTHPTSLEKHPDKTYIGKIDKGFDFLGYHFSPDGLSIAEKTLEPKPGEDNSSRLESYVRRWVRWTEGGLSAPAVA